MGECTRGAPSGLEEGRPATEAAPKAVQAHRHNHRQRPESGFRRPPNHPLDLAWNAESLCGESAGRPNLNLIAWTLHFSLHHLNVAIHHEQTKLIELLGNIISELVNLRRQSWFFHLSFIPRMLIIFTLKTSISMIFWPWKGKENSEPYFRDPVRSGACDVIALILPTVLPSTRDQWINTESFVPTWTSILWKVQLFFGRNANFSLELSSVVCGTLHGSDYFSLERRRTGEVNCLFWIKWKIEEGGA